MLHTNIIASHESSRNFTVHCSVVSAYNRYITQCHEFNSHANWPPLVLGDITDTRLSRLQSTKAWLRETRAQCTVIEKRLFAIHRQDFLYCLLCQTHDLIVSDDIQVLLSSLSASWRRILSPDPRFCCHQRTDIIRWWSSFWATISCPVFLALYKCGGKSPNYFSLLTSLPSLNPLFPFIRFPSPPTPVNPFLKSWKGFIGDPYVRSTSGSDEIVDIGMVLATYPPNIPCGMLNIKLITCPEWRVTVRTLYSTKREVRKRDKKVRRDVI